MTLAELAEWHHRQANYYRRNADDSLFRSLDKRASSHTKSMYQQDVDVSKDLARFHLNAQLLLESIK